jgi:signal transduction histidine kinase
MDETAIPPEIDLPILIVAGTLAMLLLAVAIVLFVVAYQKKVIRQEMSLKTEYAKELLQATIDTQEEERRRIARDLHDDIGATLSAVKLGMNHLHNKLDQGSEAAATSAESKSLLDEAIGTVRKLSKELLPATLEEFGLTFALMELCSKLDKTTGATIEFMPEGEPDLRYDAKLELGLYRAFQESVNNAMKHASAKTISVDLDLQPDEINMLVRDDGVGFDKVEVTARKDRGLGLMNIQSRMSMADSIVQIESERGKGTKVFINVKLD